MPTPMLPDGARAAISVTYDDALPVHRTLCAPMLSERGLRGTFYVPAAAADLHQHTAAWRDVATAGHELGNHTCWHPCRNDHNRMAWVKPTYDLRAYDERRIQDEIRLANRILHLIDGQTERTFAATCGHITVGPTEAPRDFTADLKQDLRCIRSGGTAAPVSLDAVGFIVPHVAADHRPAAELIAIVEAARAQGGWVIFMIHGVGAGTHNLHMLEDEHRQLLDHLAAHRDDLWVAPTVAVARHLAGAG